MLTLISADLVEGQRLELRGEIHSGCEECSVLAQIVIYSWPERGWVSVSVRDIDVLLMYTQVPFTPPNLTS